MLVNVRRFIDAPYMGTFQGQICRGTGTQKEQRGLASFPRQQLVGHGWLWGAVCARTTRVDHSTAGPRGHRQAINEESKLT